MNQAPSFNAVRFQSNREVYFESADRNTGFKVLLQRDLSSGWHHIKVQLDFQTLRARVWLDGILVGNSLPISPKNVTYGNYGSGPLRHIGIIHHADAPIYLDDFSLSSWTDVPTKQTAEIGKEGSASEKKGLKPGEVWKEPVLGMEFVWVPDGCYEMGCASCPSDWLGVEKPVHTVCIDGFWMGRYEVTQGQWRKLMGVNPSRFKNCGDDCPVEMVSWNEAAEFVKRLSQRGRYTFRLPTEAEWEYACRSGGRQEKYSGGDNVNAVAWHDDNSGGRTHPVGKRQPNGLGIYDMSGNVKEWCLDWYANDYYSRSPKDNPQGPSSGTDRVVRGGMWLNGASGVRCSDRTFGRLYRWHDDYGEFGFRLVRADR